MKRNNDSTHIRTPHDKDLRDLTEAVDQLRLAQTRLNAVIARVEQKRAQREQIEREEQLLIRRRQTVHPPSRFAAGEFARAKNPNRGNQVERSCLEQPDQRWHN